MRTSNKIFAVLIMGVFILPNMYSIIFGREAFPFTPAPMFAHHIGTKTLFYDINFVGQSNKADTILYPSLENNAIQYRNFATMRFFLNKVYGSAEAISPLGYFAQDNQAKFEKRMSVFMSNYFRKASTSTNPQIDTIRLEIKQYNRNYQLQANHIIGYYNTKSKTFKHVWKRDQ